MMSILRAPPLFDQCNEKGNQGYTMTPSLKAMSILESDCKVPGDQ